MRAILPYLIGNEAEWTTSPINVFSKRGGLAVQLFTSELKDGPSRLSKDEFANF